MLGGARGTNEDAFAWAALADALDVTHRDAQLGDGLPAELLALPRATIDEAAAATTVVLLGPDLKEELPVLYLRLRHAAEQRRRSILELAPGRHRAHAVRVAQRARRGRRRRRRRRPRSPTTRSPTSCAPARSSSSPGGPTSPSRPTPRPSCLRAVLDACPGAKVLPALRRGNVVGALQLGLRAAATTGSTAPAILAAAAEGRVDLLVLLGADPIADCPDADLARRALAGARRVIAVDTFLTESSAAADVVLAAAAFGEKSGTTTNLEGRVTRSARRSPPPGRRGPDWMIAAELAERLGHDDVGRRRSRRSTRSPTPSPPSVPAYAGATRAALRVDRDGVLAVPAADARGVPASRRRRHPTGSATTTAWC